LDLILLFGLMLELKPSHWLIWELQNSLGTFPIQSGWMIDWVHLDFLFKTYDLYLQRANDKTSTELKIPVFSYDWNWGHHIHWFCIFEVKSAQNLVRFFSLGCSNDSNGWDRTSWVIISRVDKEFVRCSWNFLIKKRRNLTKILHLKFLSFLKSNKVRIINEFHRYLRFQSCLNNFFCNISKLKSFAERSLIDKWNLIGSGTGYTYTMSMQDQYIFKSSDLEIELCLWSLLFIITLTVGALLIFFQSGVENWPYSQGLSLQPKILVLSQVHMTSQPICISPCCRL